jgi:hypothetical protein
LSSHLAVLPLALYRLRFVTAAPIHLPDYAGSAWRGVFGHALKRLVCVTREPLCTSCLLYRSCVYPYFFETPPDPSVGKLRKYTAAPHPFVLIPALDKHGSLPAGTTLERSVTLFGPGNRHLPYVIHSLDQAGQRGLNHAHLALQQVEQADIEAATWQAIYAPGRSLKPFPTLTPLPPPCPERVTLVLETPLRLRVKDHYLNPQRFHFGPLFSNLLRRISLLTTFHTDTPLETDFAALAQAAHRIEVENTELRWHDWTRYSSRQDTLLKMGGLLGRVTLAGSDLSPFWPYLWLGQWTHAGKGTSMGLGKYRLERP